jgi:hypothetical protein
MSTGIITVKHVALQSVNRWTATTVSALVISIYLEQGDEWSVVSNYILASKLVKVSSAVERKLKFEPFFGW